MHLAKTCYLYAAAHHAARRANTLAAKLTLDPDAKRELLRAEIDFQSWFVDSCQEALRDNP